MKKMLVVLAALVALALAFTACGGNNDDDTAATTPAPPAETTGTGDNGGDTGETEDPAPPPADRATITIGQNNTTYDTHLAWWPSETHRWLEDRLGANIEFQSFTADQTNLALAAGDLPDLFIHNSAQTILDGGFALALDEYLNEFAPLVLQNSTRNDFIRRFFSNDTGRLYFHTPQAGYEDRTAGDELWQGHIVRWDLFKEIGAPPINNDDDYIAALRAMIDLYPTNADGQQTYAFGVHNDWGLWGWMIRGVSNGGYNQHGGWNFFTSTRDSNASFGSMYLDRNSPFWNNMHFYNRLHRYGMLDPDSFLMTSAELGDRATMRRYVGGYSMWFLGLNSHERQYVDENSLVGFMPMFGEGLSGWYGQYAPVGWTDRLLFVNSRTEHRELAISFLNLMNDPDVLRTHYSGIQGVHWDYVDGVPRLFAETIELRAAGGDAWTATGIGSTWGHMVAVSGFGTHPDGHYFSLWDDNEIKRAALSPIQLDFSDFWGINHPSEMMYIMAQEGRAYNQSRSIHTTVQAAVGAIPEDIQRITGTIDDIALRNIPDLVLAATDEAFEAAAERFMNEVRAANHDTAWEWWYENWGIAREFVQSIMN